ncbi:cation efflux family protein family [Pyricularia oryzae Y34]|nr:cation efflux family protein family [Pyricularia oryzae Y34]
MIDMEPGLAHVLGKSVTPPLKTYPPGNKSNSTACKREEILPATGALPNGGTLADLIVRPVGASSSLAHVSTYSMIPPPPPHCPRTSSPPAIVEPQERGRRSSNAAGGFTEPNSSRLRVPSPSFLLPPGMTSSDDAQNAHPHTHANGSSPAAVRSRSPAANPFNFETKIISTSPVRSNIGQRRGHRYKHSSISAQHQIFQEPPQRPPPILPASLPVPTVLEAWSSMTSDQRNRLFWCLCHAAVAIYVFFSASGSLAMTAMSHLIFFDVGSAAICVAVDVLGNFEVWRRSSVRHPFGLQRSEVLAGFAMSIFLVFGGFDLISHNLKHTLESVGSEEADHHPAHGHSHGHSHGGDQRVTPGTIDLASLLTIVTTLISAYGLKNHGRIRRVMRVEYPSYLTSLPGVLANPFHLLTLLFSSTLLILPLLSVPTFGWLDGLICAVIAVSMFALGFRLAIAQGLMLLMSYRGGESSKAKLDGLVGFKNPVESTNGDVSSNSSISGVVREIEAQPNVSRVDDAQFWQVHYGLCMANLKICVVRGCDDSALSQLRSRVTRLIQTRLGEAYGRGGGLRWDVTVQLSTDSP